MHAPVTPPHTVQRDEKNRRALRPFSIAVAVLLMQAQYAYAQHASAPAGPSEKEKAKAQEKRAFEKDTDEAYKSTLRTYFGGQTKGRSLGQYAHGSSKIADQRRGRSMLPKADIRRTPRDVRSMSALPQKRTLDDTNSMSALCQ